MLNKLLEELSLLFCFFDMIITYTQLYLVFGGIIDFYSQKIFMVWLFEYSMSSTIGRNIHGKEIKLFLPDWTRVGKKWTMVSTITPKRL